MASNDSKGGGLSLQTLVIASLSSLAAALFIHKFWQGGAILGAAVTPVIVAIVSEALRKPADVVRARTGRTQVEPPPVVTPRRDDPYGIWEQQKPRRRLHVGLAIATGLVAFVVAAFVLTGAELVLGGASDGDKYRVLPGKQERKDRDRDDSPSSTQPEGETPAPQETTPEEAPPETTPEEAAPEETTPEEAPPEETVPLPEAPETTPVP